MKLIKEGIKEKKTPSIHVECPNCRAIFLVTFMDVTRRGSHSWIRCEWCGERIPVGSEIEKLY